MNHSINLYNPALRKRKTLFSAFQMIEGLALVVMGIIAIYAYALQVEESLRRQEINLGRMVTNAQTQLTQLAKNLTANTTNRNLSKEIQDQEQQLYQRRQLFLAISGRLERNHGYSRYLRAFARQSLDGLWLLGFSIDSANNNFKIRGRTLRAELIPRYLKRLSQESALEGRYFATLDISEAAVKKSAADKKIINETFPVPIIEFTLNSTEKVAVPPDQLPAKSQ